MFHADACYKIIFDAMLGGDVLENIAVKVCDYIGASVFFVLNSGEVLACGVHGRADASLQKGYLSLEAYDRAIKGRAELEDGLYQEMEGVYGVSSNILKGRGKIGSIVIHFTDLAQKEKFQKISVMLGTALNIYFKDKEMEVYDSIPMRRQICGRTFFDGSADELGVLEKEAAGGYVVLLLPCGGTDRQKAFQKIQEFWGSSYFKFEEEFLCAVLCEMNEACRETFLERMKASGLECCASEVFADLKMCRVKREILGCMDALHKYGACEGVMQERDWYVQAVYTCTAPLIREAGLSDYCIQALLKMDREKNTESYHTLKTYLLCENNIAETAARLHIHRNTLVYRLKQIRNYIDRDINDHKVSRELLAFMMMYDASG